MIDLIITQYSETEDIIKQLLNSINNQKNIDFNDINITIVNDCSDVILRDDFLNSFTNLKIKYIRNDKNTGVGLARQKGVDSTNDLFLMFLDSDDSLYDDYVLSKLLDYLKTNDCDVLITNIAVEINNKIEIRKNQNVFPWMHGKIYKREFLVENELRFSDKVIHLDDSYFNNCMLGIIKNDRIKFLDVTTYLWKNNINSITRKNKEHSYALMIFDEIYNTSNYIYEYLCNHKSNKRFSFYISSAINKYILLNSDLFDNDLEKKEYYLNKLKNEIIKNIFKLVKKEDLSFIFNNEIKVCIDRYGIKNVYKKIDDFYFDMNI